MASASLRVLILDNYDSYTQNLRHQIARVSSGYRSNITTGRKLPHVIANDAMRADALIPLLQGPSRIYDCVIISPGPGSPSNARDAGVCLDVLRECVQTPILGVCFGHQALAHVHGGNVWRAPEGGVHGRLSRIRHFSSGLFQNIPCGFEAVRYHSLAVEPETLPDVLEPIAWAQGEYPTIMALQHRTYPHYGVQFHPESVCTTFGDEIIRNFLEICCKEKEKVSPILPQMLLNDDEEPRDNIKQKRKRLRLHYRKKRWKSLESDLTKVLQAVWHCSVTGESRWDLNDQTVSKDSFWLDTASTAEKRGRFSIMGFPGGPLWRKLSYSIRRKADESLRNAEYMNGRQRIYRDPWMVVDDKSEGLLWVTDSNGNTISKNLTEHGGLFPVLEHNKPESTIRIPKPMVLVNCNQRELAIWEVVQDDSLPFAFHGGFVGYFGYEMKAECGSRNSSPVGGFGLATSAPTASFFFADRFIVFDHEEEDIYFCALSTNSEDNINFPSLCMHSINLGASSCSAAKDWTNLAETAFINAIPSTENGCAGDMIAQHMSSQSSPDNQTFQPIELEWRTDLENYRESIQKAIEYIRAGETYEVCLTNQLQGTLKTKKFNPLILHDILRNLNPAPYSAFLHFGGNGDINEIAICCSSPERFLRVRRKIAEAKPIKGTTRRSADKKEDLALAETLLNSEKERAENMMITDLLRNDLGRVSRAGTVFVPHLMEVESYATVHQLVSTVRGELEESKSSLDVLRACFPGGSMTGAPKFRTMELIDSLEKGPRGVFSGTIGFLSLNGDMDFNIVIRTVVMTRRDTSCHEEFQHINGGGDGVHTDTNRCIEADVAVQIGAGGAITTLSSIEDEVDEMLLKAERVVKAVELYRNLDAKLLQR